MLFVLCGVLWLLAVGLFSSITKTRLFKYIENFTCKNWKFSDKSSNIFQISAQNIDCYSLEPPRRGGSNEYLQSMFLRRSLKNNVYPCKPQFYDTKVGFKRVKIIWACFRDASELCLGWAILITFCLSSLRFHFNPPIHLVICTSIRLSVR